MLDTDAFQIEDSDEINKCTFSAIIEEYKALRVELMFFLDAQRKLQQLLLSVAVGQIGVLFTQTGDQLRALGIAILFASPFVILVLMLLQLEVTSKIILVADYIHKGIKHQLQEILGTSHRFFEWEEHKASTRRFSRLLLFFLDSSKWSVFGFGVVLSFMLGNWLLYKAEGDHWFLNDEQLIIVAAVVDIFCFLCAFLVAHKFNEIDGEATQRLPCIHDAQSVVHTAGFDVNQTPK